MDDITTDNRIVDFIEKTSWHIAHSAMENTIQSMPGMHQHLYAEYAETIVSITLTIVNVLDKNKEYIVIENGVYVLNGPLENFCTEIRLIVEKFLIKKYSERWEKKSKVAGAKLHPAKTGKVTIPPIPKENNHFIPKSFLKKYWAGEINGHIRKCSITGNSIAFKDVPFGSWGYKKNLYSPYREEIFGLIESHAAEPIEKILTFRGINPREQEAILWFVAMQLTRSPQFIDVFYKQIQKIIIEYGGTEQVKTEILQQFYELLVGNNTIYQNWSSMLMGNVWCILNTPQSEFILPDTAGLVGKKNDHMYAILPLTPKHCFFILPVRENKPMRVHVDHVDADNDIVSIVYNALICGAESEFVGDTERQAYPMRQHLLNSSLEKVFTFLEESLLGITRKG